MEGGRMSSGKKVIIVLAVIAFLAISLYSLVAGNYNKFVKMDVGIKAAWSQVENQLQRRYDLIPNLVTTAEAYLKHESHTLEAVTIARNNAAALLQAAAAQPGNLAGMLSLAEGEQQLTAALRNLNVAVEAYPELRAEQTVKDLHEELAGTENRVSFARQAYNDAVMEYNNARETFPASLFAAFFGHPQNAALLQFDDHSEIQQSPRISLNTSGNSH